MMPATMRPALKDLASAKLLNTIAFSLNTKVLIGIDYD
jgi:hypothetical protein